MKRKAPKAPRRLKVKPPKVIRHKKEYIRNREKAKLKRDSAE